jgi:hypothetical protein
MNLSLEFYHFSELYKNGYTLDMVFLLKLAEEDVDIKLLCAESPKLGALYQGIYRKGLLTEDNKLTLAGKAVLQLLDKKEENVVLKKKSVVEDDFNIWWKTFPGTDTFVHNGVSFAGTRSLRAKKDECKLKLNKILAEGEYTIEELVQAIEYEVLQKKENSVKTSTNKLSYMQNSLTYLNQRTFEPFIELVREGHKIVKEHVATGSTDI